MSPQQPRIVVEIGRSGRLEHVLQRGTTRLGRRPDSHIRIDDPTVSGAHAHIVWVYDPPYIQDLGSTNGTFVNGRRIGRQELHHGDLIRLGRQDLQFRSPSPGTAQQPSTSATRTTAASPRAADRFGAADTLNFEQISALVSDSRAGKGLPIPTEIHWVAQDAAGVWWGFEHRPHPGDSGWRELDLTSFVKLGRGRANPNWRQSLRQV